MASLGAKLTEVHCEGSIIDLKIGSKRRMYVVGRTRVNMPSAIDRMNLCQSNFKGTTSPSSM